MMKLKELKAQFCLSKQDKKSARKNGTGVALPQPAMGRVIAKVHNIWKKRAVIERKRGLRAAAQA